MNLINLNSKGSFTFETTSFGILELYDLKGVLILKKDIQSTNAFIETQGLANGMYVLQFNADNQIFRNKIIIEH